MLGNLGDTLEALLDRVFAADLSFEDLPIVNAVLARLSRVTNYDAAFEFIKINAQFDTTFAAGGKLNGRSSAKSRRVVVLRAGRDVNDDGFGVAADVNPILFALPCPRIAVQRRADGHGHGAGTPDASPGGSFRIRHQREAALRAEELGDFREQRKAVAFGLHERGEGRKAFLPLNIARHEADGLVAVGLDTAGSIQRNGSVEGYRARMKKVKRPDVEGAAGKVHTRWCLRFDNHRWIQPDVWLLKTM